MGKRITGKSKRAEREDVEFFVEDLVEEALNKIYSVQDILHRRRDAFAVNAYMFSEVAAMAIRGIQRLRR